MKILIAGDFCQQYRVDEAIKQGKYGDLFDEVKPIIEQVDYGIVNFEFPIVQDLKLAKPIQKCGPNLRGTRESIEAIRYAGFNVCTLANNHILDQGEQCCLDTKRLLEDFGLDTVGVGKNLEEACEILYLQNDRETLAIINCCEREFSIATETTAGANPLNPIRQYYKIQEAKSKADYVLVIVHGGHEHYQLPSPRMKETYRFFINAGADAVVNHHQHCYSGYEVYKKKPIFYGIGNFCFDNMARCNTIWNDGYMVTLDFQEDEITYYLIPYRQCLQQPTIELLSEEERNAFNNQILIFNNIISADDELVVKAEEFYLQDNSELLFGFEPYRDNKLFRALYRRHLVPSFLSRNKIAWLINFIECESQVQRLLTILHSKLR